MDLLSDHMKFFIKILIFVTMNQEKCVISCMLTITSNICSLDDKWLTCNVLLVMNKWISIDFLQTFKACQVMMKTDLVLFNEYDTTTPRQKPSVHRFQIIHCSEPRFSAVSMFVAFLIQRNSYLHLSEATLTLGCLNEVLVSLCLLL